MDQEKLVIALRELVDLHGAALVSVWLGYRDARSIGVWLSSNNIPRVRRKRVEALVRGRDKLKVIQPISED